MIDRDPGLLVNIVFGNLPLGVCLGYQLQDYGRPNTTFLTKFNRGTAPQENSVPQCLEFPDTPQVPEAPFDLDKIRVLNQTGLVDFFVEHVLIDLRLLPTFAGSFGKKFVLALLSLKS